MLVELLPVIASAMAMYASSLLPPSNGSLVMAL